MANMLNVTDMSFKYQLGAPWVIRKTSMTLQSGLYGLIGLNGSGKTTLLKCLAGIYHAQHGEVQLYVNGKRLKRQHYRETLGYVPQLPAFYEDLTVVKYLHYIAEMKLMPQQQIATRIDELLAQFRLSEWRKTRIDRLSVGQCQRLMLAQALLAHPRLLLLDEPLDGLDLEERNRFMEQLHDISHHTIIIMASHIISEVEQWLDQALFIVDGTVTAPKTPLQWKMSLLHDREIGDRNRMDGDRNRVDGDSDQRDRWRHVDDDPTLEDVLFWLSKRGVIESDRRPIAFS